MNTHDHEVSEINEAREINEVNEVNEVRKFIQNYNKFYIAGHIQPDGDSIGACFGLGLALEKLGKKAQVFIEPYHTKYNIIPGNHLIYDGEITLDILGGIDKSDDFAIICLDCADITRLEDPVQELAKAKHSHTLCIDHHYSNTKFARYNYVDGTASSTCEMVYRILSGFMELNCDIATALYSGMVTDTGGFRHSSTSEETLRATADLTSIGIPFQEIYRELINLRTYTEVKLLARVLNAVNRSEDAQVVHVCVPKTMLEGFDGTPDASTQDLEGIVEFLLNIRRAKVALLVYERAGGGAKISLRSRRVNVGAIAQQFGGGGHQLAAGAAVSGDIYEIRDKLLPLLHEALTKIYEEKS